MSDRPSGPLIAIVEDDEAVLAAVTFAMAAEGYDARGFTHAGSLLRSPVAEIFDCLVVDLKLPDGDGLSLIRSLRARGLGAPAILITTHPDARLRKAAAALAVAIVEKPLMGEGLSLQVRRELQAAN